MARDLLAERAAEYQRAIRDYADCKERLRTQRADCEAAEEYASNALSRLNDASKALYDLLESRALAE
jgi:hypothetical protein